MRLSAIGDRTASCWVTCELGHVCERMLPSVLSDVQHACCWPCPCPLFPRRDGVCCPTQTLVLSGPASRWRVKVKDRFLLRFSLCWAFDQLLLQRKKLWFFLLPPAAWLGLHCRAGFQRAAMRSSHSPRLQDALILREEPCRVGEWPGCRSDEGGPVSPDL